jgi:hypothetical protein
VATPCSRRATKQPVARFGRFAAAGHAGSRSLWKHLEKEGALMGSLFSFEYLPRRDIFVIPVVLGGREGERYRPHLSLIHPTNGRRGP